ncbi:hypothetical protein I316_04335 [Kwoniella heveanensis BCC8398]|uniref:Uncharacterized protein n=1 Tax=Kwoniella heveanensis BCC8398 TaxID=1296120 RepID=A0A1B9GSD9_9TREE|nr:hypothetical protein I316_04335 [Kwoniella heveanensis BCC8398]
MNGVQKSPKTPYSEEDTDPTLGCQWDDDQTFTDDERRKSQQLCDDMAVAMGACLHSPIPVRFQTESGSSTRTGAQYIAQPGASLTPNSSAAQFVAATEQSRERERELYSHALHQAAQASDISHLCETGVYTHYTPDLPPEFDAFNGFPRDQWCTLTDEAVSRSKRWQLILVSGLTKGAMPVKSSSTTGEWDAQTDIEPVHRLVCIPPHNRTLTGSIRDEIEELSDTFRNDLTFRRVISEELGLGPGRSSMPTRLDVTSSMEEYQYQAFTQARLSEARMIG